MSAITQRLRLGHILRTARHSRLTTQLLELLIEANPVEARVMGLDPRAYAGIPERWIHRDARGAVRMIVIGD